MAININLTLLGEMITFATLVGLTLKYIWPPIDKALKERQKKIADGIASSERGQLSLAIAQQKATEILRDVNQKANGLLEEAQRISTKIVEDGKVLAEQEKAKILSAGRASLDKDKIIISQELQVLVSSLVVSGVEKVLKDKINDEADRKLIDCFIDRIGS